MKLASNAFGDNEYIPARYSKKGENVSPSLEFIDVPTSTKSLALVCHDPDSTNDFTHWIVWNIDPTVKAIKEGSLLANAIQGVNSWGTHEWGGPQPPSGTHRYIFELYALDIVLNLPQGSGRKDLQIVMSGHVIDTASLSGLYSA